jgi:hypothetical protein
VRRWRAHPVHHCRHLLERRIRFVPCLPERLSLQRRPRHRLHPDHLPGSHWPVRLQDLSWWHVHRGIGQGVVRHVPDRILLHGWPAHRLRRLHLPGRHWTVRLQGLRCWHVHALHDHGCHFLHDLRGRLCVLLGYPDHVCSGHVHCLPGTEQLRHVRSHVLLRWRFG